MSSGPSSLRLRTSGSGLLSIAWTLSDVRSSTRSFSSLLAQSGISCGPCTGASGCFAEAEPDHFLSTPAKNFSTSSPDSPASSASFAAAGAGALGSALRSGLDLPRICAKGRFLPPFACGNLRRTSCLL